MKAKRFTTLIFSGFLLLALSGLAQAEVTWDQVKKKIQSANDYTVKYSYNGPQGIYDFDYRYGDKGDKIRTEITGSKSDRTRIGTVIVWDKSWSADKVRAKTGGGLITRNLTHKEVVGRPWHEGIFQMILRQVGSATPKAKAAGKETIFDFPGGYTITANDAAEIVQTRRKDGTSNETRVFSGHTWNTSPKTSF